MPAPVGTSAIAQSAPHAVTTAASGEVIGEQNDVAQVAIAGTQQLPVSHPISTAATATSEALHAPDMAKIAASRQQFATANDHSQVWELTARYGVHTFAYPWGGAMLAHITSGPPMHTQVQGVPSTCNNSVPTSMAEVADTASGAVATAAVGAVVTVPEMTTTSTQPTSTANTNSGVGLGSGLDKDSDTAAASSEVMTPQVPTQDAKVRAFGCVVCSS